MNKYLHLVVCIKNKFDYVIFWVSCRCNIFSSETKLDFTLYIIFCRFEEKFLSYCLCYFDYKKISHRVNILKCWR